YPNPDLEIIGEGEARWHLPANRRRAFQNFSHIHRYGLSFRAARVLRLTPRPDPRIGHLPAVKKLIANPWFSAMGVAKDNDILFEAVAADYQPDQPHALQSITKTMIHLIIGRMVADRLIDLNQQVKKIIPELGTGYDHATIQQLLNMDVENDYSENTATLDYYEHSEAMGWQLPRKAAGEMLQRPFLSLIANTGINPPSPFVKYKDANTDVLAWAIERLSNRPLRQHLADIVDAAGIEGQMIISCDRDGIPVMDGGACLTLRDLLRYGLLFPRGGGGVNGHVVGNKNFMQQTLKGGLAWDAAASTRYANHTETNGRALAHPGYGGQYLFADLTSGIVIGFLSVNDQKNINNIDHYRAIWDMMTAVATLDG
ncbi:MAG: serine hydrolase, partial [Alphaproteobacteria bacterium]|nr:serine hydrolase [Alphaproteobacteria bacterium]